MKTKLKEFGESVQQAYDYFMYHPDKTEVILQVYLLNPVGKFIEGILFWKIDILRKVCFFLNR